MLQDYRVAYVTQSKNLVQYNWSFKKKNHLDFNLGLQSQFPPDLFPVLIQATNNYSHSFPPSLQVVENTGHSVTPTKPHHRRLPSTAPKHSAALQTFVRLIDCLIASTLREVTACEGKAIYSRSPGGVGEEREVKAEGRTQLNQPQHLLLQHGLFLPDPFTCD